MEKTHRWILISGIVVVVMFILGYIFRSNAKLLLALSVSLLVYQVFLVVKFMRWLNE